MASQVSRFFGTSTASSTQVITVVPAAGVAVGRKLIVCFGCFPGTAIVAPTCVDSKGNGVGGFFTLDKVLNNAANVRQAIFSSQITVPLVSGDTITCTQDAAASVDGLVTCLQWDGLLSSGAFDQSSGTNATSASPASGVTGARAQDNEIVIGVCSWIHTAGGDTFTLGSNFSDGVTVGTNNQGGFQGYMATEYRIVNAVGTDQANGTLNASRSWGMSAVTYKATSGLNPGILRRRRNRH